jgi:hypothetical protein
MESQLRCAHCNCLFKPNPRVKNQRYCSEKACQRARKNLWQKEKMANDPDYKANQRECQRRWRKRNPGYWKKYRDQHPESSERNRILQKNRDSKRRASSDLAKMDESDSLSTVKQGTYYLVPVLAQMDAPIQKVILIPTSYP